VASDGRTGLVDRARRQMAVYGATRDRFLGYEDAVAAAGIDFDGVPVIEALNHRDGAATGAGTLLDRAPDTTAILAMSDVLALGALGEAQRRGLRVPEDLSIVGYDDVPEAAAASPPLTTVAQPIAEKGRLAARMIFDHGPPRREVLPVKLVMRGTTAAPRQDSSSR
jgi:DNA-binding LacI/PurR family transcriptional regulator